VEVAIAYTYRCARRENGELVCWSREGFPAEPVDDAQNVVQLAFEGSNACFRTEDGRVACLDLTRSDEVAFTYSELTAVADIQAGPSQLCARTRDADVWCRGAGEEGELGVLPRWLHLEPVTVPLPASPTRSSTSD